MKNSKIRVGIIGANPDRSWASHAHIPALKSLPQDFEITALSTSRPETALAAGKLFGVPRTFARHEELVGSADVDVVAIAVKVPYHLELASAAMKAGKAVYCEWPLGRDTGEAAILADLARTQGVLAVTGLQARFAPAVAYARDLITQGYLGEVLSTTLIGSGMGWGPETEPFNAYTNDKHNGATMLSIPLAHTFDALCHILGEPETLSATMALRRRHFTITGSPQTHPRTAEDQIAINGSLGSGATLSIHYRGGRSRATNLLWEINGTEGDLQFSAAGGHAQIFELTLRGAQGEQSTITELPIPEQYRYPSLAPLAGPAANIARAYANFARDFREGSHFCATFDDAIVRHRTLDAIVKAAETGQRQHLT